MRYLILAAMIICNCSHKSNTADDTFDMLAAKAKRDRYVAEIPQIADQYGFIGERCDGTTFTGMLAGLSDYKVALEKVVATPGQWLRHPESCYPNGSDNETSLDVYLGALYWIYSQKERHYITDIKSYGKAHNWIMGEGDIAITNIVALLPLINEMDGRLSLFADSAEAWPTLEGHRGHIVAMHILLHGRLTGAITAAESLLIEKLAADNPDNPLYAAINARFHDGDYSKMLALLQAFPDDLYGITDTGAYGWGSAPRYFFLITSVGIAEGK